MPALYHTTTAALMTPERFPEGALLLDVRCQRFLPPWGRAQVAALFPSRYLAVAALGTRECAAQSHDPRLWQPYTPLLDWRQGLQVVQQAAPTTDVVVLCTCLERYQRSHRRQVATSLAQALGFTVGGNLP